MEARYANKKVSPHSPTKTRSIQESLGAKDKYRRHLDVYPGGLVGPDL